MSLPRLALVVSFVLGSWGVGACGKNEPPPEPLGCKQAKKAFEKIGVGIALLAKKVEHLDTATYCGELSTAVKSLNGVAMVLFVEGAGSDAKARAAASIHDRTKGLLAAADDLAAKCPQEGIAGTQAALKAQLAKARVAVETSCDEK